MRFKILNLLLIVAIVESIPATHASWIVAGEATKLFEHSAQHFKNDPISFYKRFNLLLHNCDLIGCPSTKVKEWFGEPYKFTDKRLALLKSINVQVPSEAPGYSSLYYRIPRDSDAICFHVVRFRLKGDKIIQWSIIFNNIENQPITSNVVLKFDSGGSLLFHESKEFRYPETTAKSKPVIKPNLVDEATKVQGPRNMNGCST
ncbi:MAG: hypothetical protein SFY67_07080 [Candidatus Melainabacteria bacterium]|nr:hypothetical protein [Candidatus Melainabacteria bacterium]